MVFWAFSFIWFKVANKFFPPLTIVFIRLVLAVAILTIYLALTKGYMKIRKQDLRLFLMLAVFEPFLYFLGESFGLTYVSATVCSVLISTIPVFAALGARFLFREKLSAINYSGIICSFIGVLIFIIDKNGNISFDIRGLALLSLAVISAVGYNLTLSRLVGHYSPVYIVNVQNIIGAILFLPIFLIADLKKFMTLDLKLEMFIPVAGLAFFASCGAFILFAYGVKKIGVSKANVFTNCIPVFTALFSFIFMADKLSWQNYAGMIVVITGLFMSQADGRGKNKKENEDAVILTGKTA